jgi:cell wall-associated NlpC family hydrolase
MWGKPYIWGGDDPVAGFDCSGLVIEILKSVGILKRDGDWTAAGLMAVFPIVPAPHEGCLVFWENGAGKIVHVEYCLDGTHSIGASGGASATTSAADAIKQNAYVKVRPMKSRAGIAGYCDPFV